MTFSENRIGVLFDLYDTDADGRLSQEDLAVMANRVISAFGLKPDSAKAVAFVNRFHDSWDTMAALAGDDGTISRADYVAAAGRTVDQVPEELAGRLRDGFDVEFAIADTDDDGVLTREEFIRLFVAFGLTAHQADAAFERLDRDDDETLSREEYALAWTQFVDGDGGGVALLEPTSAS